jgi:acetyl-CoA synthetase
LYERIPRRIAARSEKETLGAHCKNLIAAYNYPREVEFAIDLPRTTSGKTRRVQLREAVV